MLFISPDTLPPPVVQMALDPYLEKPETITVEINLHAPDKNIWPQIRKLLKMVRCSRGYTSKRERRNFEDMRELLRIYDEVQARLKAKKPKFPGSPSNSKLRVEHAKYQAIEHLVQGGYKRFVFGYSDVKS